jgi:hypothetical protein
MEIIYAGREIHGRERGIQVAQKIQTLFIDGSED